uniref:Uncharacterized protein n=1 Tax=Opuntia streptacantha TaxID=393608 RepID=A0A7C9E082_OPUST
MLCSAKIRPRNRHEAGMGRIKQYPCLYPFLKIIPISIPISLGFQNLSHTHSHRKYLAIEHRWPVLMVDDSPKNAWEQSCSVATDADAEGEGKGKEIGEGDWRKRESVRDD